MSNQELPNCMHYQNHMFYRTGDVMTGDPYGHFKGRDFLNPLECKMAVIDRISRTNPLRAQELLEELQMVERTLSNLEDQGSLF